MGEQGSTKGKGRLRLGSEIGSAPSRIGECCLEETTMNWKWRAPCGAPPKVLQTCMLLHNISGQQQGIEASVALGFILKTEDALT